MLRFLALSKDGEPLYGVGLSDTNVRLLQEGNPIEIDLDDMNGKKGSGKVLIFAGRDELSMAADLDDMITEDTEVHIAERFKQ